MVVGPVVKRAVEMVMVAVTAAVTAVVTAMAVVMVGATERVAVMAMVTAMATATAGEMATVMVTVMARIPAFQRTPHTPATFPCHTQIRRFRAAISANGRAALGVAPVLPRRSSLLASDQSLRP